RLESPTLVTTQRPRLLDSHPVTDFALVRLVVNLVRLSRPHELLVLRVLHLAIDGDDDRLLHLVADDHPFAQFANAALRDHRPASFSACGSWRARSTVNTRAKSLRARRNFIGFSFWLVPLRRRRRSNSSRSSRSFTRNSSTPSSVSSLACMPRHPPRTY